MGFLDNMLSSLTGGQQNGQQGDAQTNGQSGGQSNTEALVKMLKNNFGLGAPQERPGKLCFPDCTLDNSEHCAECVKEQDSVFAAIDMLEELERAIEITSNSPQTTIWRPKKCSLCGAPIETSEQACPYCDTPYPPEALIPEIPRYKREQQQLLLQKSVETYKTYSDWYSRSMDRQKGTLSGVFGGFVQMMSPLVSSTMEMNEAQIQQGAQHYGVSCAEYVSGVIQQKYMNTWGIKQEAQAKIAEENQKRRSEELEKRRQELEARKAKTDAEWAERKRAIEKAVADNRESKRHFYQIQQDIAVSKVTDYGVGVSGGGSSSCCGNCKHYIAADNKCAYSEYRHPTSANDYCNNFWRR